MMPDREKVIKGLEYCISLSRKLCGSDCPYFENEVCCIDEMQKDAIELLKEQQRVIEQYHKADGFLAVHGWKWSEDETEWCDRCGRVRLKSKWEGR